MAKRKKLKEGVDYILTEYIDNSAPCGKCVFLYLRYGDAKCTFPKRKKKKCKHEPGTTKGWNTLEYTKIE